MQKLSPRLMPIIFFLILNFLSAQITFNEVMYNPATSESHDEYIEIYNLSDSTIDLSGWYLADSFSTDNLADYGEGMLLAPYTYAVILDGSYSANSTTYDSIIPLSALKITIDNNTFTSGGLSNSSEKTISIHDISNQIIDTYRYSLGNTEGHSDEKIIITDGNQDINWSDSEILGGTPGSKNSVAPYDNDLSISLSAAGTQNLITNTYIDFTISILNKGRLSFAGDLAIQVYIDLDNNNLFTGNDISLFNQSSMATIDTGSTAEYYFSHMFAGAANHTIVAELSDSLDENTLNNKKVIEIALFDNSESIHINEIKFLTTNTEPEWIELYNAGLDTVTLLNWAIADLVDTTMIDSLLTIAPGEYKVLAENAGLELLYEIDQSNIFIMNGLPSLNNYGDVISLINPLQETFEQVPYVKAWLQGEESRKPSLERINVEQDASLESNWGPSVSEKNATPGAENSNLPPDNDLTISLEVPGNENLVKNTDVGFSISILNLGQLPFSGELNIKVYIDSDKNGEFSNTDKSLFGQSSLTSIDSGETIDYGFNNTFLKAGDYSIIAEITDSLDEDVSNNKAIIEITIFESSVDIHINEIKFLTDGDEPEWLELYNSGTDTISLLNWAIADLVDTTKIDSLLFILPGEYKVITEHAGLELLYDIDPSNIFIMNGLPSLNNSGDVISLITPLKMTFEHVPYLLEWLQGKETQNPSLERISIDKKANLVSNWGPSSSENNATPGKGNSILPPDIDLAISLEVFGNENIIKHEKVDFSISVLNLGKLTFSGKLSIQVYIDSDNNEKYSTADMTLFNQSFLTPIDTGDTEIYEFNYTFSKAGDYSIIAVIADSLDENVLNNKVIIELSVYESSANIHINEIKFLTIDTEPEWLEIYNSGPDTISLSNWAITDLVDTTLINSLLSIAPGEYKILAADSGLDLLYTIDSSNIYIINLPSFNNSEDVISLLNPLGEAIEQVPYTVDWLEGDEWRNPSLERINPQLDPKVARNWGPCTAHNNATPGEQNALFSAIDVNLKSKISISPNPFSPDNDGIEDHALINLQLPVNTARIKVEIYDVLGRKVKTLKDNSFSSSNSIITWNGKNDDGRVMRMGIYIVFVQILNDHNGVIREMKETVVVAGRL